MSKSDKISGHVKKMVNMMPEASYFSINVTRRYRAPWLYRVEIFGGQFGVGKGYRVMYRIKLKTK